MKVILDLTLTKRVSWDIEESDDPEILAQVLQRNFDSGELDWYAINPDVGEHFNVRAVK